MAVIEPRRTGALTTEAALFLPVLVLLLLAGAESGWFTWRSWQIGRAVQRGVEVASTSIGTEPMVEVAVADAMRRAGLGESGFQTTVGPALESATPGAPVTVTVTVPYPRISLTGLGRLPFLPRRLVSEATLAKQAPHRGLRSLALAP